MAVASQADYVVAVVGDTVGLTGEKPLHGDAGAHGGPDRAPRRPPEASDRPLVVVLIQGNSSTLPASELGADAIVQAAFPPGMRGGRAIAEFTLGCIEPSGRLPLGVPRPAGQPPAYCGQVRGHHGRFGEGLSCTTVNHSEPAIRNPVMSPVRTDCPASMVMTAGAVQGPPHGCEAALARWLPGRRPGFGIGGAVGVFRRRGSRSPAW
ncbi:glycoside hydrolase family 3 protein [Streptomyces sp. ID05-47C]|uniref:glycoside hydrolase family 3 protein n=1 Tax=Streptomyces sp. ID05-47C TaxID=3028665 RepID=UPI0039F4F88B